MCLIGLRGKAKNLIIVGCGRIGSELAQAVLKGGHQAAIIERSAEAFERLRTDFDRRTIGIRSIATSSWSAQHQTQLLTLSEHSPILTLGHGEISLVEIAITEDQTGRKLSNLQHPDHYPVAVIRNGNGLLPNPELKLQVGDLVVISLAAKTLPKKET